MIRKVSLVIVALSFIALLGSFQSASAADTPSSMAASGHFDADAATAAYLATMTSAARARSDAYYEGGYWLMLWDFLFGLLLAWALLGWQISARMRDFAARLTRFRWAQTALYAIQYFILTTVLTLPWAAYEGYVREHQYGMSNQGVADWLGEQTKGLVITLIFGTLAAVAIYAVIRKLPKTWWLWGSAVAILFLIFQIAIGPTYVEPVFNKFYPLAESPLKHEILSLARANGIPVNQVYEFDASKQTTKMSAHVSGIAGSAQISLNDNLINRALPEEVEAVVGHEMGHYVLNHVYKGVLALGVLVVIGFAFMSWAFGRVVLKFGERWGFRDVADVAGLPLLVALFSVYGFVLTPVFNTVTRSMEAEADAFGLNAVRQPDGAAQAALHLAEYRKMQPGALEEVIFFDHPSGWNRIHRAMIWKAENFSAADIAAYDALHSPPGVGR
ncbi:MAG TPA: M48 family metallopeptidase [Steroidobacteraceae bacterium]|jgi:STE24 endopeptidase|nr:M48 family metallopeptidase [Steroidobacteraceae bacterium]